MFGSIRQAFSALKACSSGNAALIVALALPALIGGGGLAVDTAQWFAWKRELQFAVDQAALAGAWARTVSSTKDTYISRARQEYATNLQVTRNDATPSTTLPVSLVNYNGGVANAVRVTASVSKRLPFSSLLTGAAAVISVRAQASVTEGGTYSACLIAVDPNDDMGAIDFNGNIVYKAKCGVAALSTNAQAIKANGISANNIDPGTLLARGGIDSWFSTNGFETHPYFSDLYDPYADLQTPTTTDSAVDKTYTCVPGSTTTTASVTVRTVKTYSYVKGSTAKNGTVQNNYTGTGYLANTDVTGQPSTQLVANGTVAGTVQAGPTADGGTQVAGSGSNKIWRIATTTTYTTYANVIVNTTETQATVTQGTYSSIDIKCKTVFTGGIYVIDGGVLKIPGQYEVTGSGVLFILKNKAYFDITGGSSVNLTGMTTTQGEAAGLTSAQAVSFENMLFFEDRATGGAGNKPSLTGNATTVLNGTIYLPKSNLSLAGTAKVTSTCLIIAAYTVKITGTADFGSFCPDNWTGEEGEEVASTQGTVKLVT